MAKSTLDIPYIYDHREAKRYRRIVPSDIQEKVGKKVWLKPFPKNTSEAAIRHQAAKLAHDHDRIIAAARGQELDDEQIAKFEKEARQLLEKGPLAVHDMLYFLHNDSDDKLESLPHYAALANALKNDGKYVPKAMTLSAAYERDKKIHAQGRDEKPIARAFKTFVEHVGDKDLTAISRGDVSEWLADMSLQGLAPATIKRRLGAIRAIVNRAFLDFDIARRNPFENHSIKGGSGSSDDRLPFNKTMLAAIDHYLSSNRRLGHETVNIMRLMKGTGCGPAEIGGLALTDVRLGGEIPFLVIRQNTIRGVKTDVRERRIPLAGEALMAAHDAYKRASIRSKGKSLDEVPLFTSFGINGRGADSISAKLNKAIRTAGVPKSPRLTSYSFRHTIKEALRSACVLDHVQRRILGHSGEGVADRYGSPQGRLSEAKEALGKAMDHLGDVDDSIYRVKERMAARKEK